MIKLFKILLITIGLIIFVTMHGTDVSNVTSSISVNKTIIQNSASEVQESSDYAYENDLELT